MEGESKHVHKSKGRSVGERNGKVESESENKDADRSKGKIVSNSEGRVHSRMKTGVKMRLSVKARVKCIAE